MKRKHLYLALGAGVVLLLLLRKKSAAPATSSLGGFAPVGLASLYFDPGQTFDINANVNSRTYGQQIN